MVGIETERFKKIEIDAIDALWAWLETHHEQNESVWLVTYKGSDRKRYVSRDEVLDALIAFGWIDGVRRKLDAARTMQLISKRREYAWAQTYKDRAARLQEEGRMRPSGLEAINYAKTVGLWNASRAVDNLNVPDDLAAALSEVPAAKEFFEGSAPSYRRNVLRWIDKAKRPQTRAKRIAETVKYSRDEMKVRQL